QYTVPANFQTPTFDRQPLSWPSAFGDEWAIISEKTGPPNRFAVLLTLIFGVSGWLLFMNRNVPVDPDNDSGNPVLFAIICFGLALASAHHFYQRLRQYQRGKRFGSPILLLEHREYLPGESLTLAFHRDMLPEVSVKLQGDLSAWLVGMELTRRTQGTDTILDRVIFHEENLGKKVMLPGSHQLRGTWHVQLPGDARPTLLETGHWVVWLLQVRQNLPGQLEEVSDFMIPVVPQRSGSQP
ncbi:hypothetical protein, partial [Deinococcus sp.]|uniref:hypothetical protein n=1 Tax=Deinococcus sp. TaxID=47478 RepID=UPI0025C65574